MVILVATKKFEDEIFAEIKGRIKEDDITAPVRRGSYYYYERTLAGKEYVQHCRRLVSNAQDSPTVYDEMPTGPEAPPEHVILDENVQAKEHSFYQIGGFKVKAAFVSTLSECLGFFFFNVLLLIYNMCRLVPTITWWHMQKTQKEMRSTQFT